MSNREIMRSADVIVRVMELEQGSSTEWHHHTEVRDFFVCLTGAVQVETRTPESVVRLLPGEQAEVLPLTVHRVVNAAAEKSQYLLVQGVGAYDFKKD